MKKSSFYNFCFLFFCAFFLLILVGFGFMQTEFFQKQLVKMLAEEAERNQVTLCIDELKGFAPLKWSLKKASFSWKDGKKLTLEDVQLRIAFFPLFKKELSISSLRVQNLKFSFPSWDSAGSPFSTVQLPDLPFNIFAKTVQIRQLILQNLEQDRELILSLMGKARVQKNLKEIQFDLMVIEPSLNNSLHIQLLSSERKNSINAKVHLDLQNTKNFLPFFHIPAEASLKSSIRCWGKWSYWQEVKQKIKGSPLIFSVQSSIDHFSYPPLPFLDRKWDIDLQTSLFPDLSSRWENFSIESNWLRFLGKGSLSSSLLPLEGSAIASIEKLEELSPVLSFPLAGKIDAKTGLKENAFILSISSPSLTVGKEVFSPAGLKIESNLEDCQWIGKAIYALENPDLPWRGSSDFTFAHCLLDIQDIDFQVKDGKISGKGCVNLQNETASGSFFIFFPELRSFRTLFPYSDLEGKLGGNCSFDYTKEDLFLSCHLKAKNIRYQSSMIHSVCLDMGAKSLFQTPSGTFSLECDNLLTRGGQIKKLRILSSETPDLRQAYTLEAFGDWKQEFYLSSSGFWEKNRKDWKVNCSTFEGKLFNLPFQTKPFIIEEKENTFSLQQYSLDLGSGNLTASCTLNKDFADFKTKATHLPLDIFTFFYPNVSLYGSVSFEGSLRGNDRETPEGYFLASLEEATLPQMQAKGSLQMHMNPRTTQIHSHFYATKEQFIDWTATLPLRCNYRPFHFFLDPKSRIASELTSEGDIDAIFNFLQMANQKTSGWMTSHLFLSGTPTSPYLNGEMQLQNCRYENYFSGTKAKDIFASLTATGSTIDLQSFTALDKEGGKFQGVGTLTLNTDSHFPFKVDSHLENFGFVQSDAFRIKTTGDAIIYGNTLGCTAKGDLQIDSSTFFLSDKLPTEIPTLPVQYVNKPIHLQQSEVIPSPEYPFHLELNLSANDTVFIKGRGLDSTWNGNVFLTGTPNKLTGKGSLKLKKGEFVFSGKTFTLMHGDLVFSDKPDQESYLALTGQLALPSATIIANLQGPLTSPRLTFQSIPPLPTSSILSLILFNKDISEISPLQALQLAQVIMSLSGGGGPDVLESIRKTIGVDKLNISGKDDELSLQIGWCITHGVTVSLSQSATSSDITIEVDLKNGFIFEAETQNQEEGKFSLKWNHNY